MRWPRLRVRTLMLIVGLVALLLWGAMLGYRAYEYSKLAAAYASQASQWSVIPIGSASLPKFDRNCEVYCDAMARKYRGAAWRPWMPVPPDPESPCKGVQRVFISF